MLYINFKHNYAVFYTGRPTIWKLSYSHCVPLRQSGTVYCFIPAWHQGSFKTNALPLLKDSFNQLKNQMSLFHNPTTKNITLVCANEQWLSYNSLPTRPLIALNTRPCFPKSFGLTPGVTLKGFVLWPLNSLKGRYSFFWSEVNSPLVCSPILKPFIVLSIVPLIPNINRQVLRLLSRRTNKTQDK